MHILLPSNRFLFSIISPIILISIGCTDKKIKNENNEINNLSISRSSLSNEEIQDRTDIINKMITILENSHLDIIDNSLFHLNEYKKKLSEIPLINAEEEYKSLRYAITSLPVFINPSNEYQETREKLLKILSESYDKTATPIEKKIHIFIVGDSLTDSQVDSIRIWTKINPDYQINIWFSPDNIFANRQFQFIKERANAIPSSSSNLYQNLFGIEKAGELKNADKIIKLQNQYNTFRKHLNNRNKTPDEIRIAFIKEISPEININTLNAELEIKKARINIIRENLTTEFQNIHFMDIQNEIANWNESKDYYERELHLNMNFRNLSNLSQWKILEKNGGIAVALDVLPNLKISLSKILESENFVALKEYIKKNPELYKIANKALLEAVLNKNLSIQAFMQNRLQSNSHFIKMRVRFTELVTTRKFPDENSIDEFINKINSVAEELKDKNISEIFTNIGNFRVRNNEIKASGLNHDVIASHPKSRLEISKKSWITKIKESIFSDYNKMIHVHKTRSGTLEDFKAPSESPDAFKTRILGSGGSFERKGNATFARDPRREVRSQVFSRYDGLVSDIFTQNDYWENALNHIFAVNNSWQSAYQPYRFVKEVGLLKFQSENFQKNSFFTSDTEEDSKPSWFNKGDGDQTLLKIKTARSRILMQLSEENDINEIAKSLDFKINETNSKIVLAYDSMSKLTPVLPEHLYGEIEISILGHGSVSQIAGSRAFQIASLPHSRIAMKIKQALPNVKEINSVNIISCYSPGQNHTQEAEDFAKKIIYDLETLRIKVTKGVKIRTAIIFQNTRTGRKNYLNPNNNMDAEESQRINILARKNHPYQLGDKIIVSKNEDGTYNVLKKRSFTQNETSTSPENETPSEIIEEIPIDIDITTDIDDFDFEELNAQNTLNDMKKSVTSIRNNNQLNSKFIPIFHTLNEESKSIVFLDPDENIKQTISLENHTTEFENLKLFKNKLNSAFEKLNSIPMQIRTADNGRIQFHEFNTDEPSGISEGFFAQMVINYIYSDRIQNNQFENTQEVQSLQTAMKVHAKLYDIQIAYDVMNDFYKVTKIIQILRTNNLAPSRFVSILGKTSAGIGTTFSLANVGLDIYQLRYALTQEQKIIFGTQLGFDSLSASLGATSLIAGTVGASSLAAASAAGGTLLAGVGIAFTAFAQAAAAAQAESIAHAKHFYDYQQDHIKTGNNLIPNTNILSLAHNDARIDENGNLIANLNTSVVNEIDFTEQPNKIKITFGSHLMYKTKNMHGSCDLRRGWYITNTPESAEYDYPNPTRTHNENNMFKVRDFLGNNRNDFLNKWIDLNSNNEISTIILPIFPEKYISYSYSYTPGILTRRDDVLSTVKNMTNRCDSPFLFSYFVGLYQEEAIRTMNFNDNKDTEIKVRLDGLKPRVLITPNIPEHFKNKISYKIFGDFFGKGISSISLSEGAKYHIIAEDPFKIDTNIWFIDASSLNGGLQYTSNGIRINNVPVRFSENIQNIIIKLSNKDQIFVNLKNQTSKIISIDPDLIVTSNMNENIKEIAERYHQTEGNIQIDKFQLNNNGQMNQIKAWYDINENKFIYPNFPNNSNLNEDSIELVGKNIKSNGNYNYLFSKTNSRNSKKSLYKQEGENGIPNEIVFNLRSAPNSTVLVTEKISHIDSINNNPIIYTENGYIYTINENDEPIFSGLTSKWLTLNKEEILNSFSGSLLTTIEKAISLNLKNGNIISILDETENISYYNIIRRNVITFPSNRIYIGNKDNLYYFFLDKYNNKVYYQLSFNNNVRNFGINEIWSRGKRIMIINPPPRMLEANNMLVPFNN